MLSNLPRTFRDAIQITRRLGYRFVWIDSLCIFQDSREDWEQEAASMGRVYQNCVCTISAVGAKDSQGGCFAERDPLKLQPCWLAGTEESNTCAFPASGTDDLPRELNATPLKERAWVLQERLLSPRALNYGTTLVWECQTLVASESCPRGLPDHRKLSPKPRFRSLLSGPLEESSAAEGLPEQVAHMDDFLAFWLNLVEQYSKAGLTYEKDRQVVVSGIIDRLELSTGMKAFDGLWDSHLLPGLLRGSHRYSKNWRSASKQAPTWSWLSIEGPVIYEWSLKGIWSSNKAMYNWVAEVVEANIAKQGRNSIRISGHLQSLKLAKTIGGFPYVESINGLLFRDMWFKAENPLVLALDTEADFVEYTYYLPLLSILEGQGTTHYPRMSVKRCGLVLVPNKHHANEYRRIGLFQNDQRSHAVLYEDQENNIITIV
ncbi:hypothetical protein MMC17_001234 [Xylographa soralifera]|nr:hypothetical protein [Xylographa soralifera]